MNDVQPTELQLKTLELLAENPGMAVSEAMKQAGYSPKTAEKPTQNFTARRGVLASMDEYRDLLRRKGITEEYMATKTAEWLEAQKVISARIVIKKGTPGTPAADLQSANARTDDFIEVPDYQTQLKAAEMVRRDLGIEVPNQPLNQTNIGEMQIHLTPIKPDGISTT